MSVQNLTPGVKPIQWPVQSSQVAPEWDWNKLGLISLVGAWRNPPWDHVRRGFWTANSGGGPRINTRHGIGFEFNDSDSRSGDAWQIINSLNNLLELRSTFTFGMLVRMNYSSTSTDEDTLFGHWDNINGAGGGQRKKILFRWDSGDQQFEMFVSSDGTSDQAIGNFGDAGFDDGKFHTVVVVVKAGAVTVYRDAKSIGTGSFTGTISAGSNSHLWELPGGHQTSDSITDSPRVDFLTGFVSSKAWPGSVVRAWHVDPFALLRPDLAVIGKAPAVGGGLSIPVAMYNYRRRRAA